MKNILMVLASLMVSTFVFASEKSLYNFSWVDNDKEIYVLQNRKFRKVDNFYIGATGAYKLSQDFVDAYGGTLRAGYFFTEDWGIEGVFGKNTSTKNDSAKGVESQGAFAFTREIESYMGAMAMWSPFYSKINTFNRVVYFDWMFGLGLANVQTKDNRNQFGTTSLNTKTSESNMGAMWNTGFRFYINENWSLRLDVTGLTFKAKRTTQDTNNVKSETSKLFTTYDLGVGLNYAF